MEGADDALGNHTRGLLNRITPIINEIGGDSVKRDTAVIKLMEVFIDYVLRLVK
jgi:hypothetical protein